MQYIGPPVGVAAEVWLYLRARPNAAETLEGILNWWLPRQRYETERRRVEQALDELLARGLIAKQRLIDGTILYTHHHSAEDEVPARPSRQIE